MSFNNYVHLPYQTVHRSTSYRPGNFPLGQIGVTEDGRTFRLVKNAATQLATARVVQAPAANIAKAVVVTTYTAGIGAKQVQVTVATVTANQYQGGFLNVEDDNGEGYLYPIVENTATDNPASGDILVTLAVGLEVAFNSATTVGLYSPYNGVVIHPSPATTKLVGVTCGVIPASYYFWAQIRGLASVLTEGTVVINEGVVDSATADGAVAPSVLTEATPNTGYGQNFVGIVATVGVTTEQGIIDLALG